jgi:hypothetical protein
MRIPAAVTFGPTILRRELAGMPPMDRGQLVATASGVDAVAAGRVMV